VNRYRLPRWVNAAIDGIADAPMSPAGRLAARRLGRPAPVGTVPVSEFDATRSRRVLIAPVNYSGQGFAWARALERAHDDVSARNMAVHVPGGFAFPADLIVPVGTYHNDPDWQRRQFDAAARATHVLIEAEEPPFGRLDGRSVRAQALALAERGVDVAFLGHGTDVRLPSRHIERERWSYFADESVYRPRAEVLAARNIALLRESGRTLFVSTPDLLSDLPEATWCPVAVDPELWSRPRAPRPHGAPLRVAHAPSVGPVKGTALIMPALERLEREGVIRLELVQGRASAQMPDVFAQADVVLDQFRIGSYGVAACEAMASGAVVVGHVGADVRQVVREATGQDVPIIEADPLTLEGTLRTLAAEEDLAPLRRAGEDFVRDVHDGRRAAQALGEKWIHPIPPENEVSEARRASPH
jgi:hypothetical protein